MGVAVLLALALSASLAAPRGDGASVYAGGSRETHDRDVDEVALASQEKAVQKLQSLLKKYRGTRQEPTFLARLAELQQQNAAIRFRIAHGRSHRSGKALDLGAYRKMMLGSIETLTRLIGKFPEYAEMPLAYSMRGKGYEEIGDLARAGKDYLHLIQNYPDAEQSDPARMSLAEFAIQAGDHARAVRFLREVELRPDGAHYPFALYKLAWSHFNLKDIPSAMTYVRRHIRYYDAKRKERDPAEPENTGTTVSDEAFRENMLLDSVMFYAEGREKDLPEFATSRALSDFRELDRGPALGRMIVKYAKLLRSHGKEEDLTEWTARVLEDERDRPESLDVVLIAYESQLNKRQYPRLVATARDFARIHRAHPEFPSFGKAQKMLLETADGLQKTLVKNRDRQGLKPLTEALASVYDAFVRIVDPNDPRVPRVHYNLAETLFEIEDFEGATGNYLKARGFADAPVKAIASRYEELRKAKLVPTELKARSLADDSSRSLDPKLTEWVVWIDQAKPRAELEQFFYEAARSLYSQGRVSDGASRMDRFARRFPRSKHAVSAASLALDTEIASLRWEEAHALADSYLGVREWKGTPFQPKLQALAADTFYKTVETAYEKRDLKRALSRADAFLKRYASSARLDDCLNLAGNAALADNQRRRAMGYFGRLLATSPKSPLYVEALLARGSIADERYRFGTAARDYLAFLEHPAAKMDSGDRKKLRRKALALAWLSDQPKDLGVLLASPAICASDLANECERYQALGRVRFLGRHAPVASDVQHALAQAREASEDARPLWAAVALDGLLRTPGLKMPPYREQLALVRQVSRHWNDLDGLASFSLIESVSASVPAALERVRASMKTIAPLRATERHIAHRIDVIREVESAATHAMKLPWSRLRASVLSEIAGLYLDLSRELQGITPKGLSAEELAAYEDTVRKLTLPFEEKGQEMRGKAFEIASRFSIEDDAFRKVAEPFFQDNPSQAKALRAALSTRRPSPLDLDFLDDVDPKGKWSSLDPEDEPADDEDDPVVDLKARWARAVLLKRWNQVAFFLQEAREKALIDSGPLGAVRAVSLAAAGARGEGLAGLEEARAELPAGAKATITRFLTRYGIGAES